MDDLAEVVRDAINAVVIDERGSFSWFGYRTGGVPRRVQRSANRTQLADYLRFRLQHHLYRNFYLIGFAAPLRDVDERDQTDAPTLVDQLSRANCGRGVEQHDWKVILRRRSTAVVSREGLTLEVGTDRITNVTPASVSLRYLNELIGVSPGFYTALGDLLPAPQDALIRLYWNLRAGAAVKFIRQTTRLLNEESIPFRAKILSDARRFDRCDAAVLYLVRSDYARVYPTVRALYQRFERHLKPLTPVFTKRIGRGVAVAEDPPDHKSFGQNRCGIVAEALLRAHLKRKRAADARLLEVVAAFERQGISFHQPYLNPGSADVYPHLSA